MKSMIVVVLTLVVIAVAVPVEEPVKTNFDQDFTDSGRPAINKQVELTPALAAPILPDWCHEYVYEDVHSNSQNSSSTLRKQKGKDVKETTVKKTTFMTGVRGVEPFDTQPRFSEVQKKTQNFCKWNTTGFPGAHPVSMNTVNLMKLHENPYRVSWKADGVRYLMLIDGEGEVYMLDRDNCAFKVFGLRFLHRKDLRRHLKNTLIDGEMVIDKENNQDIPRYLIYDIISFEGTDTGKMEFYPTRMNYIESEIINPRLQAMEKGIIQKELEPFSIRLKQFWALPMSRYLLSEEFAKTLSHESDGLIFEPSKEGYLAGPCPDVLKWKPSDVNSIDFVLKIVTQDGQGNLPTKVGYLYVGQMDQPFASIEVTKDIEHFDNKIIECSIENGRWVFMRERTDKSCPNDLAVATTVFESIRNPVTKEILLDFIDNHRFRDDSDELPGDK